MRLRVLPREIGGGVLNASHSSTARVDRGRRSSVGSETLFRVEEGVPDADTFLSLRAKAGMRTRSREGSAKGLGQELFSVLLRLEDSDDIVGMGRVIGDGGTIFVICDMLVIEEFQRNGGGTIIMNALMEYLLREAPPKSYINLMADVDGFYERWGFVPSLPRSRGMVLSP
ncbi:MAG: N-acetyltransferase [Euryarchaeota archaeon]|nr:N-acetyltransferase [Euryarchaeota archaeon]